MSLKKIRSAFIIFIVIIFLGGFVYSKIEGWSYIDAIYFSTVTVTTLGYGDFVPLTPVGKIFTIFFSLSGIAIGLYILTVMGKYMANEFNKKTIKKVRIKKGESVDVSKLSIHQVIEWGASKGVIYEGLVIGLGQDSIRLKLHKKNNKVLRGKSQEVVIINSKGKLKK